MSKVADARRAFLWMQYLVDIGSDEDGENGKGSISDCFWKRINKASFKFDLVLITDVSC